LFLFGQAKAVRPERDYATSVDFCSLFKDHANRFYFLAYLLTGDRDKAEQCFVTSLESCLRSQRVFKEWGVRWATHTILKTAMEMMGSGQKKGQIQVAGTSEPEILLSVMRELTPFERFAYVMTVLENYSDHECATLLGRTLKDVRAARDRALVRLGGNAELLGYVPVHESLMLGKTS
jgi:DNA-directed RNA polymerase specialized sigma24 family protein